MSNSLFDNAPEYDSDLDTLADFVIEPTTAHVPPPPSPAPNTCLCGRTTRDDDLDDPLYCSEACARLDAFHALTARSRSNSLAPTPIHTAPTTPLGLYTPLRESIVTPFNARESMSTPPFIPTPLSNSSSLASMDSAGLPIEMGSHYRRVFAKRERMERERSRSHSRTHSKARPSLGELEEECLVETHIEREAGSDGEDHVPAPPGVFVHVAVDVQVEHEDRNDSDDHSDESDVAPTPMLGPAPGVAWYNPFADGALPSPARELAPHNASDPDAEADVLSITESELSPFMAYAPVAAPPPGLRTRKSSVCFAGVGPAGRMESAPMPVPITRSCAQSDSKSLLGSVNASCEKPLPPTPDHGVEAPKEIPETRPESVESADVPAEPCSLVEGGDGSSLSSLSLDQSSSMSSEVAEPTTPVSSTAPASPRTPNARIHPDQVDPLATPSRLSSSPAVVLDSVTPKRSPAVSSRPSTSPRTNTSRKPQAIDTLARAKIFSMVLDPELDVFGGEILDSSAPQLKRAETAPELNMGWGSDAQSTALAPAWSPETPRRERHTQTRARATSTPRRPIVGGRQRTTSTPSHPGLLQLAPRTPRRPRMHVPPPTPPVSPSHVSSPRPPVAQDPGSWQSFGAAFDAWGWNMQGAGVGEGMHRRQESGESTGSSATDVSWASSSGAPLSGSSLYSWPTSADTSTDVENVPSVLRARSPATSSVRTVVPPIRSSSLVGLDMDESEGVHLHLCHTHKRRSRRHSSIAALDSILAMEDDFWGAEPVVVRPADESIETEGVVGQFTGDAGGFSFPAEKDKVAFEPVLRIAGVSRPSSRANLLSPNVDSAHSMRRDSGIVKFEHLDPHAHRLSSSQFPSSPSVASARPSPEIEFSASPAPAYLTSTGLFDIPLSGSPSPALSRGSPALASGSPVSLNFAPRTPSSPYLSVPLAPSRRASRSTDASSVLMRTASAARLAAALNAATDDEDELHGHEDAHFARYSPGTSARMRRSGSEGRASSLSSGSGLGLGLVIEHDSRARSSSEPWAGTVPGSVILPGVVVPGTVSRSGSRMNLLNPTTSVLEEEEEEEEDYGQVVSGSKFSGMESLPVSPAEQGEEASPLIDAFPHPMGGYFPGSRFASRANTPVRSLKGSASLLSLRQVAAGVTAAAEEPEVAAGEESVDEDEEVVTRVQRMRHSMQLLTAA